MRASDVRFLPIVSAYARTLDVVEEIDRLCGHERGISPGRIVLALMVDALSGRTPLFRLPQAFAKMDTELLLGEAIASEKLNDDAVGRVVDRLYEVGTSKVLSAYQDQHSVEQNSGFLKDPVFVNALFPKTPR